MNSVIGSLAGSFHQASRTEYLAQFLFSGLGSAVAVPRQEDSGIDLYCTLGTPDPDNYKRLLCRHPFYVQVKSKADPIVYKNEAAIEWLISLPQPYFICVVTRETLRLQVYHSLPLFLVSIARQLPQKLVFELGEDDHWDAGNKPVSQMYDFQLGKMSVSAPILDFTISDVVGSTEWYQKAQEVLESWLNLAEFNIAMRTVGLPVMRCPNTYTTNMVLPFVDHVNDPLLPGGSYREYWNASYARKRKEFKSLTKRVYGNLIFDRHPDEIGDRVAWLLEQELRAEGRYSLEIDEQEINLGSYIERQDPYNLALANYTSWGDRAKAVRTGGDKDD